MLPLSSFLARSSSDLGGLPRFIRPTAFSCSSLSSAVDSCGSANRGAVTEVRPDHLGIGRRAARNAILTLEDPQWGNQGNCHLNVGTSRDKYRQMAKATSAEMTLLVLASVSATLAVFYWRDWQCLVRGASPSWRGCATKRRAKSTRGRRVLNIFAAYSE